MTAHAIYLESSEALCYLMELRVLAGLLIVNSPRHTIIKWFKVLKVLKKAFTTHEKQTALQ